MDAVLKKEKERIIQREIFKKKYKLFSSLVCLQNRRVFANFKNSFYDIATNQNIYDLKNMKQYKDESAYLDFISSCELKYFNNALDEILSYIFNSTDENFSVANKLQEIGIRKRFDFLEEFGIYPENIEIGNNINKVKKCFEQQSLKTKKYHQCKFVEKDDEIIIK